MCVRVCLCARYIVCMCMTETLWFFLKQNVTNMYLLSFNGHWLC